MGCHVRATCPPHDAHMCIHMSSSCGTTQCAHAHAHAHAHAVSYARIRVLMGARPRPSVAPHALKSRAERVYSRMLADFSTASTSVRTYAHACRRHKRVHASRTSTCEHERHMRCACETTARLLPSGISRPSDTWTSAAARAIRSLPQASMRLL